MAIGLKSIKGKNCPVVYCDACGKRILKGSEGGVNHPSLTDEQQTQGIRFFHKNGRCSRKWKDDSWAPLDFFLVNLLHNCGIKQNEIEKNPVYKKTLFS